jgi:ParB-like chromosome segregation protein Spo0J
VIKIAVPKGDIFELISGHRRVQAAKEIGWTEIEVNIKAQWEHSCHFLKAL